MNLTKMNRRALKKILEVRPVYLVTLKHISQKNRDVSVNSEEIFKFYDEEQKSDFSDKFKPLRNDDYNRFFSKRALSREPAITRMIASLSYKVGKSMISLAEGMPNEKVFPFDHLRMQFKTGGALEMRGEELVTALQYVPSQGLPSLLSSLREFQSLLHRPPHPPRDVIVSNGSQHGIYQCCELLVEPGDPVLMSEYSYTGMHVALKPYDPEIMGIPEDQEGIRSDAMDAMLSSRLENGLKMPKMLYVIPTGNNPSGTVISNDRKREIYELACKYDFLIIEDDPYMFLNYTEKPVSSFLSMDSCGRVIRLDSISKVVSAGLRAGWTTAPTAIIQRMELHSQAELLHSCSLTQAIMNQLLSDRKALAAHMLSACEFYRVRRDKLHEALLSANVAEVAEWTAPDAGLFLWMKIKNIEDVYNMVFQTAFERGLMLIPGHAFLYNTDTLSTHLRLTFSKIPVEKMDAGARTLVEIIRNEQRNSTSRRLKSFAIKR